MPKLNSTFLFTIKVTVTDLHDVGDVVDPSEYYLCSTPYFETESTKYDWLNRIVSVGVGRRMPDYGAYDVFEIL